MRNRVISIFTALMFGMTGLTAQQTVWDKLVKISGDTSFNQETKLKKLFALYEVPKLSNDDKWLLERMIGNIYYEIGDQAKCLQFMDKSLQSVGKSSNKAEIINVAYIALYYFEENGFEGRRKSLGDTIGLIAKQTKLLEARTLNLGEKRALAIYHMYIGDQAAENGLDWETIAAYKKSLQVSIELQDYEDIALINHQLGYQYDLIKDYKSSIEHYLQSIEFRKKAGIIGDNGYSLNNLARNYIILEDYDKAVFFADEAIRLGLAMKNVKVLFKAHQHKAKLLRLKKQFRQAEEVIIKGIEYASQTGNDVNVALCKSELATVYLAQGQYAKCLPMYQLARKTFIENEANNEPYFHEINRYIGQCHIGLRNFPQAALSFKEAYEGFASSKSYKEMAATALDIVAMHKASGNLSMALQYADSAAIYKDSANINSVRVTYKSVEEKYDNAAKALTIEKLKSEQQQKELEVNKTKTKMLIYGILALAVFAIAGLVFRYAIKIRRQKAVLEETNIKLEEANETQNRLFSIISHDLKGMIIPFQRAGRIMKSYIDKGEMSNTIILTEKLEENATRLSSTLNNMLHWALHQMKGIKINKEEINVRELVAHVVEHYKEAIQLKENSLAIKINNEDKILADPEVLSVVMRNLISNAIKYTERGTIVIEGKVEKENYILQILDSGKGMNEEILSKLFLNDADKIQTGTKGEKGSGIGTLVIKKLLDLHGANINVVSQQQVATKVTIVFPNAFH